MTKQVNVNFSEDLANNQSTVYLIKEKSQLDSLPLSKQELDFLISQFENDEKFVSVNSYDKWNYVYLLPKNSSSNANLEKIRIQASDFSALIIKNKFQQINISDLSDEKRVALAFAEGIVLASYKFNKYFTDKEKREIKLEQINLKSDKISERDVELLNISNEAVFIARDIVNEPLSHFTASTMGETIQNLGAKVGLDVEVFDKKRIEALRMGGLLAVNRGSQEPPSFSIMTHKPANAINEKPYVVVGKGVVFDTGGLSLKPTQGSMDSMKSDKAGAAATCGIMYAVAKANLPIYVIGLVPATDNRPGENAYAPQDIITMFDGTTVEVLNTDAEGRMILADALAYAKKYNPELVVDLATLTGAALVALGVIAIAAMGNETKYMEDLKESGENVYERIAELPMWEEYKELIKSDFADLKNTGGRYAGTISAGKFLEHFTDYPWIHLDIAGPAYLEGGADKYRGKAATGSGVRLLFDFFVKKSEL
ncbi:MAG: leucyl aminopeptidase [Bacteroidales bacterium]|nr:leucyl aminopeptidase [Bacteroidales bacterium]